MEATLSFYTIFAALAAGGISFISPCVLPLVPPYLGYMAGVSVDMLSQDTKEMSDDDSQAIQIKNAKKRAIVHSLLFVLGFSLVFIGLGASASTIGLWLRTYQDILAQIAGIIIIVMGLHFLGLFKIGFLYKEARFQTNKTGHIGSLLIGIAFAFGWTPCIGPILGTILSVAGSSNSVADGAILLAFYSAGLGIPFLAAAFFVGHFMKFIARFKRHLGLIEKIMGVLLVLTGIMFLTGGMERVAFWLLESFPVLGTIG
ncbi:MAG: cytochrome c biogenesis CcdA family protein [Nitratireductor sp.]